ncbi:MAG: hypothetical protein KAX26_09165 [Anaerolineae bacterium]|nr:hypothetical protein [Anaerolineae bacterium]
MKRNIELGADVFEVNEQFRPDLRIIHHHHVGMLNAEERSDVRFIVAGDEKPTALQRELVEQERFAGARLSYQEAIPV